VHVKAVDNAGNYRIRDVNTYIDTTPPSAPTIIDDGIYTSSTSQLHASWHADDAESGVVEYQYAIGTAAGAADVVGWTSVGAAASVTRAGLSLLYDQAYYFSVKARNGASTWSAVGSSDGITTARFLPSISAALSYPDGSAVMLVDKPVSAKIGSAFWIQEDDRSAGIKVSDGASISPGTRMTVAGRLGTSGGQRSLGQAEVLQGEIGSAPAPIGISHRNLGGKSPNAFTPAVKDGLGPYNIGLLVRIWGVVTKLGSDYFYIDDGAGLVDGSSTGGTPNMGVRILAVPGTLVPGDFVVVTGASSAIEIAGEYLRAVLPIPGGILRL